MDNQTVKNIIENLLLRMNVGFEAIEINRNEITSSPRFLIKSADSAMLIGTKGGNLLALNYLVRKMVSREVKENEETFRFFIDVNNYQEKLEEELKNKARIMGERARSFKVDIELDPMSSYERMIIHSYLQNQQDIRTESKGEGKNRRVVIKYVES